MVNINTVQIIEEKETVPVRAVPFVTGDDISPLGIAQLLASPEHCISAYVLNANGAVTKMLPKEWRRYVDSLNKLSPGETLAFSDEAVEILPASTFLHLEDLWNVYVDLYLPSQSDLADYTAAERENMQLQSQANIPTRLIDMVFEGFRNAVNELGEIAGLKSKPIARAAAQDSEILEFLKHNKFDLLCLPKNEPGKAGVKSKVKNALGRSGLWAGTTVFDKAWERLLRNGEIASKG